MPLTANVNIALGATDHPAIGHNGCIELGPTEPRIEVTSTDADEVALCRTKRGADDFVTL
jgi:hypothetical protein